MSARTTGPARLAQYLLETGAASPRWAAAVEAVPRAGFVPDVAWAFDPDTGRSSAVDRRTDPDRWAAAVDSDTALTIQWDDGRHDGVEPGTVPTSSASQPSVVTGMLHDADLRPGMSVFEGGTGTGWSAALTAHAVGPGLVTTVEVDQAVAELAAHNLDAAGVCVTSIVGDAAAGHAQNAPYDRTIATYGVRSIPQPWITQTRPGGLLVAPWGTHYSHRDALAVLTVSDDRSASGPFARQIEFMKARSDRLAFPAHNAYTAASEPTTTTDSALTFSDVIGGRWDPAAFVAGLLLPGVTHVLDDRERGAPVAWWYSLTDLSWAAATFRINGAAVVASGGERDVWSEVKTAVAGWIDAGRPGVERYGLTVTPDGKHTVWLDEPGSAVAVH